MNEIIYLNNIKERLFENINENEFKKIINNLTLDVNSYSHIWYDINYINSCLELFFIYFDNINNPLSLFYSFFKKNNPPQSLLKQKNFLNNYDTFINNDIGVTENDFNIYKSIVTYCSFVHIKFKNNSILFCGISQEIPKGIMFKKKGDIDNTKIKEYLPQIVSKLYEKSEEILFLEIKTIYLKQVDYIVSNYSKFKVK